jgi:hypothetical protein
MIVNVFLFQPKLTRNQWVVLLLIELIETADGRFPGEERLSLAGRREVENRTNVCLCQLAFVRNYKQKPPSGGGDNTINYWKR